MISDAERPARQAIGREEELSRLASFLGGGTARALVLEGAAGSGKTTLWEAGIAEARSRGVRVLVSRPSGAETAFSFAALTDLLEGVDLAALSGLPDPQRRGLEVALLRVESGGRGPEPRTIAMALLNALRALAATEPLLVAVDDVQWLDPSSADALAFAARRLADHDVRFLLARRAGPPTALETALAGREERISVPRLSLGAVRRILSERLGCSFPRRVLHRLYETADGNPLFALELGRALVVRGVPEIGQDLPVPEAVEDLLQVRIAKLPVEQRRLLASLALSPDLRVSQVVELADRETFEGALDDGLLLLGADRVRPAHPLLAAAARSRTRAADRRALHRALAGVAQNESLRAHHVALAAVSADPELAAALSAAARAASARGARREAVELAQHALRLTPEGDVEGNERMLELAAHLEVAGELGRLTDMLEAGLDRLPVGAFRARAWLLLAEGAGVASVEDYRRHLESALAEARDDPALRARIVAKKSSAVIAVERIAEAEAQLVDVLPDARGAGPEVERPALFALAWARALGGRPVDDLCRRFAAASRSSEHLAESPERIAGQRLVWRGEIEEARALFERLLATADERGEAVSYAWIRLHLCELALREGNVGAARHVLDEWAESGDNFIVMPLYQRCRALLAAGCGEPEEAERWAAETIVQAEKTGIQWDWLEALRARGLGALLAHDFARAAESLRTVWAHTEREGVRDPGTFPVAAELVEALLELGEDDEARAVTSRLAVLSEDQEHPWGLATARRCRGLVEFSPEELAAAAEAYEVRGLRFDRARTLLALGRGERRLKRSGDARRALEHAREGFRELGSPGWAAETQSELDRVKGRRPSSGTLTRAEERVARLAADGLTNKEIAAALYVSVNTVEAHLSHVYTKLGVRSRGRLARHPALQSPGN